MIISEDSESSIDYQENEIPEVPTAIKIALHARVATVLIEVKSNAI